MFEDDDDDTSASLLTAKPAEQSSVLQPAHIDVLTLVSSSVSTEAALAKDLDQQIYDENMSYEERARLRRERRSRVSEKKTNREPCNMCVSLFVCLCVCVCVFLCARVCVMGMISSVCDVDCLESSALNLAFLSSVYTNIYTGTHFADNFTRHR